MVSTRNSGAHEGVSNEDGASTSNNPSTSASSHPSRASAPVDASSSPTDASKISTRNSARRVAFKYEGDEWELGASPTRPRKSKPAADGSPNHTPIANKTRGRVRPRNATPYLQRNGHATSNGGLSDEDVEAPYNQKRGSRSRSHPQSSSRVDRPSARDGRSYGAYEEVDAAIFSEEDSRDSMTQIVTRHRKRKRNESEGEDRRTGEERRSTRRGKSMKEDSEDEEEEEEPSSRRTNRRGTRSERELEGEGGSRTTKRNALSSSDETAPDATNESSANDTMDVSTNSEDASGRREEEKLKENGTATRRSSRRVEHSDEEEEPTSTRRSSRSRREVKGAYHDDDDDEEDDGASSKRRSLPRSDVGKSSSRPKPFPDDGYRRSTRSSRAACEFADDEAIEDNTFISEDNDDKDDHDENEEDARGTDMYSRVKERHKARQAAQRGKDEDGDFQSEEESEGEEEEDEEEEEDDEEGGQENRRVLRKRKTRPQAGGGGRGKSQAEKKGYSFRTKRAPTQFYQEPPSESRPKTSYLSSNPPDTPPKRQPKQLTHVSPAYRKSLGHRGGHNSRTRRAMHRSSSTSSSSSSSSAEESSDEKKFQKRKTKSMKAARRRMKPMNFNDEDMAISAVRKDRVKIGTSLADVDPMAVDKNVLFDSVGGLSRHIRSLKEMIVFPLLYPEVFDHFKIEPPRGCIFYGPPGTGKTLMARALANECSRDNAKRRVAFFMRKGADCLSKWVGESERQLRLLFDQAYQMRPSIIFFDEIDGLAPVRSSRQDQIHSSIVSTLLALMDGLDARGQVIVIGATNRLDSIDPALRRPGRFDREFLFPLPNAEARKSILSIHTKSWNPPPSDHFIDELAHTCHGYCGADLKALCTEATLCALRRRFPQIYASTQKLQFDIKEIRLQRTDFNLARKKIVPAAHRSAVQHGAKLPEILLPFLGDLLKEAERRIHISFVSVMNSRITSGSSGALVQSDDSEEDYDDGSYSNPIYASASSSTSRSFTSPQAAARRLCFNGFSTGGSAHLPPSTASTSFGWRRPAFHRSRLLLQGSRGSGLSRLAPAILHHFEKYPVHALDLNAICSSPAPPEEIITAAKREAKRNAPAILYIPSISRIWEALGPVGQAALFHAMDDVAFEGQSSSSPLMVLATSEEEPPEELSLLFDPIYSETLIVPDTTTTSARRQFFYDVIIVLPNMEKPARTRRRLSPEEAMALEPLPVVDDGGKDAALTEEELERLVDHEERTLNELRIFLREVLGRLLRDRRFSIFSRPIDPDSVPDYFEIIKNPMDLSTMMAKIDRHEYPTGKAFLADAELICNNALEYNPDETTEDRGIRHRACTLKDVAHAIMSAEFDPDFEKQCSDIVESRVKRGETPSKMAPAFSRVMPPSMRRRQAEQEASTSGTSGAAAGEDRPPSRTDEAGSDLNASRDAYRERKKRKRRNFWARGLVPKMKKRRVEGDEGEDDDDEQEKGEDEKEGVETREDEDREGGQEEMKETSEKKKDEERETKSKTDIVVTPPKSGGKRRPRGCGVCEYCQNDANCGRCIRCKNYASWRKICLNRVCVERRDEFLPTKKEESSTLDLKSPRLAESSADQDSPDVTTPPRKEPSAAPSQDDTSASDGASASFSPIEDEDSSEARSRTDKSKQKQAKSPASSKSPLKQKLKDQPLSRPSSASESSVSGSPFICDNENGSSSQPSKLVKAEALKTVEVGDEESSSASDAVVATVKASLRPIIVDENSTGSGIASSGIESDLSSTSSPKVISVDLDDGDNLASKSNLHNVVSFSIASESAEKETASSSTKSPVVAEAVSHQGLSKTPVGSAFNHLIEDALAKTAVKDEDELMHSPVAPETETMDVDNCSNSVVALSSTPATLTAKPKDVLAAASTVKLPSPSAAASNADSTNASQLEESPKKGPSPVRTRRQLAALTCPVPPQPVVEDLPLPSPIIPVDKGRLELLLDRVVNLTKEFNVHALEKLHAALSQVAWRRRNDTDRHGMVDEMESVIAATVNS